MDDADEFGLLASFILILMLLPVVLFIAGASAIGYVTFLGGRGLARCIARLLEPGSEELIERDYQLARAAMNAAAGASWRNLTDSPKRRRL